MAKSFKTFQQQAYEFVRQQILNMTFKPGEYVTDTQVANTLSISRTPVREAFHRLEKEGLLINDPHRGWRIYYLSLDDIQEIFDIKEAVEGMVACRAAQCKDERLREELKKAIQQMAQASETNDTEAWLKADHHLHTILFTMANNERARRIIDNLNDQWHRVRVGFSALEGRTRISIIEHEAFIECIIAGDGEEAERLMRTHLNRVREDLVHVLVNLVLPFVDEGV
jgi:DNA-binding GntR family transcriptional regulator